MNFSVGRQILLVLQFLVFALQPACKPRQPDGASNKDINVDGRSVLYLKVVQGNTSTASVSIDPLERENREVVVLRTCAKIDANNNHTCPMAEGTEERPLDIKTYLSGLEFSRTPFGVSKDGLARAEAALLSDPSLKKSVQEIRALFLQRERIISYLKDKNALLNVYTFDRGFPDLLAPFNGQVKEKIQTNSSREFRSSLVDGKIIAANSGGLELADTTAHAPVGSRQSIAVTKKDVKDSDGRSLGSFITMSYPGGLKNSRGIEYRDIVLFPEIGDSITQMIATRDTLDEMISDNAFLERVEIVIGAAPDDEQNGFYWALNGPPMLAIRSINKASGFSQPSGGKVPCTQPQPASYEGMSCCDGYWLDNNSDGTSRCADSSLVACSKPMPSYYEGGTCCVKGSLQYWFANSPGGAPRCPTGYSPRGYSAQDYTRRDDSNRDLCVFGSYSGSWSSCQAACGSANPPRGGIAECYQGLCVGRCNGPCAVGTSGRYYNVRNSKVFVCTTAD
jgi:hypothetical protein